MNKIFDEAMARRCRQQFPGLDRRGADGQPAVFFDGPAGTQVPQCVIRAMADYLAHHNANTGGAFATSEETELLLIEAMQAMADFVGAGHWQEIVFGQNMTSLTFHFSRALAQTWSPGDEIVVTRLDHDANVAPWVLAARDRGVIVHKIDVRPDDYTLCLDQLRAALNRRTRLVAVGCASNATGGINPVGDICDWARQAGALTYLDAVHYAPHGLIDVAAWGCDFLVCSTYKFFGPHVGVLWGRGELLAELEPYKVRPSSNEIPWRWMTGTQSHEAIAGAKACVDYLADIGRDLAPRTALTPLPRREALKVAFDAIRQYETELAWRMIEGLQRIEGIKILGITDRKRGMERFATVSLVHSGISAAELSRELGARGIYTWSGNFYALEFTERLALEPRGMLRIGLVHYNTAAEVDRCLMEMRAVMESRVCV